MNTFFFLLMIITALSIPFLLILSLVLLFKRKQNAKKFFKITGISLALSFFSLVGFSMTMSPEMQKEALNASEEEKEHEGQEEKAKAVEQQTDVEQQNNAEQQKTVEPPNQTNENSKPVLNQDEFISYAQNITGGAFLENITLNGNEATLTFFDSYASYKAKKPNSGVTEEQYKDYFITGNKIEKIFVGEPARLLRQFPTLNNVKMTLSFEGKTYSINLDRHSLNQYIGFEIESLSTEDQSWQRKFNDPYVYNEANRKKFFDKFVTVQ